MYVQLRLRVNDANLSTRIIKRDLQTVRRLSKEPTELFVKSCTVREHLLRIEENKRVNSDIFG